MKRRLLALPLLFAIAATIARADEPLYNIELKSSENFEVLTDLHPGSIVVYPVSAGMRRILVTRARPTLAAADYDVSIRIRTTAPKQALSKIVRAISEQTGRQLFGVDNSMLEKAAPTYVRTAFDRTSTWFLVLTPAGEENTYQLTCSFVVDNDRTDPAPVAPAAK